MFAALKIPKAFMGYEEDLNAKSTLAAQDIRFARTIERIQRIFVSELTKIAMVHLYSQGFEDKDMLDFELELAPASTIAEQEKMELWDTKVSLASSIKDLASRSWTPIFCISSPMAPNIDSAFFSEESNTIFLMNT